VVEAQIMAFTIVVKAILGDKKKAERKRQMEGRKLIILKKL